MQAILSESAADHLSRLYQAMPELYSNAGRYFAGPEVLLHQHMRRERLTFRLLHEWHLYRCSLFCFGEPFPCRLMLPTTKLPQCGGECLAARKTNATCGSSWFDSGLTRLQLADNVSTPGSPPISL
jgi:hypothetical protein